MIRLADKLTSEPSIQRLPVTVVYCKTYSNTNPHGGSYEVTLLIFRDDADRKFVWRHGGRRVVAPGSRVLLTGYERPFGAASDGTNLAGNVLLEAEG